MAYFFWWKVHYEQAERSGDGEPGCMVSNLPFTSLYNNRRPGITLNLNARRAKNCDLGPRAAIFWVTKLK
jgi:hypothetical protein